MFVFLVASQKELSRNLDKDPTTIRYHINKLVKRGIIEPVTITDGLIDGNNETGTKVERSPIGREIIYRFKNYDYVEDFLTKYSRSLLDDEIFTAAFDHSKSMYKLFGIPKKMKKGEKMDKIEERLFEIFPHPYHP
jgi:DNA-binding MarR family transcriptional regulator